MIVLKPAIFCFNDCCEERSHSYLTLPIWIRIHPGKIIGIKPVDSLSVCVCAYLWSPFLWFFVQKTKKTFGQHCRLIGFSFLHITRSEEVEKNERNRIKNRWMWRRRDGYPVWPDLAKIRHFCEILHVFGNFLWVYLVLSTIFNLLWLILYATGQIFLVTYGQILCQNIIIFSHCLGKTKTKDEKKP